MCIRDSSNVDSSLTTIESNISSNDTNIADLDTRLSTAETNIASNDTDIAGLESNTQLLTSTDTKSTFSNNLDVSGSLSLPLHINVDSSLTTIETNIATHDTDISGLDTRLSSAETNIATNDTDIAGLDTRLSSAETNICLLYTSPSPRDS